MVVISHKHKFIIFKSYKTGSTTIEDFFSSLLKKNLNSKEYIAGKHKMTDGAIITKHITPDELFELMPEIKDYYKICPIRNPYNQIVSCYIHNNKKIPNEIELFEYINSCKYHPQKFKTIKKQYRHLKTYYSYANYRQKECIDFFIKLETLQKDITQILTMFNIRDYNLNLIGNCRTSKLKYNIEEIYSQSNIKLVEEVFKEEIQLGNYRFPLKNPQILLESKKEDSADSQIELPIRNQEEGRSF